MRLRDHRGEAREALLGRGLEFEREAPVEVQPAAVGPVVGHRARLEGRQHAELAQHAQPARHQHLAAELAVEVLLALDQRDADAAARQQEGQRGARGSGTDHHDGGFAHGLLPTRA